MASPQIDLGGGFLGTGKTLAPVRFAKLFHNEARSPAVSTDAEAIDRFDARPSSATLRLTSGTAGGCY